MDAWVSAFYYSMSDHGVCVCVCVYRIKMNKSLQLHNLGLKNAAFIEVLGSTWTFGSKGVGSEAVTPAPGQIGTVWSCRRIKEFRHAGERHTTLTFGLIWSIFSPFQMLSLDSKHFISEVSWLHLSFSISCWVVLSVLHILSKTLRYVYIDLNGESSVDQLNLWCPISILCFISSSPQK